MTPGPPHPTPRRRLEEALGRTEAQSEACASERLRAACAEEETERQKLLAEAAEARAEAAQRQVDETRAGVARQAAVATEATAALEAAHALRIEQLDSEHESRRVELLLMAEQLSVESGARLRSEARLREMQSELDAALKACKQSDDHARRLNREHELEG